MHSRAVNLNGNRHPSRIRVAFGVLVALSLTSCPGRLPKVRGLTPRATWDGIGPALKAAAREAFTYCVGGSVAVPLSRASRSNAVPAVLPPAVDERSSKSDIKRWAIAEAIDQASPLAEELPQRETELGVPEAAPPSAQRVQPNSITDWPFERQVPHPSWLMSIGRETWVYSRPSYDSKRLGYLRFSSRVQRSENAVSHSSCSGGWYAIKPEGYVCANGRSATVDASHPLANVTLPGPDRNASLPYQYAMASAPPRLYFRELPSDTVGTTFKSQTSKTSELAWLFSSREIFGYPRRNNGEAAEFGLAKSGIAFVDARHEPLKNVGITPNLELLTMTGLTKVAPSTFHGMTLDSSRTLPIGIVKTKSAVLYRREAQSRKLQSIGALKYREFVALDLVSEQSNSDGLVQTTAGEWVPRDQLKIVLPPKSWPSWVVPGQLWVDVSIEQQVLVAYEGTTPKYVTLVSTGVDGLQDPAVSKATKQGIFRVISKHITATMSGEDETHAYEMREVPWVQYFSEGYALHAAYWHDAFGTPRSHGCVNLSPIDARYLFHFTSPGVPQGWHGRTVTDDPAVVYVHP